MEVSSYTREKKKDGGLATGGIFKGGHSGDVALEGIIQIIIEIFI